MVYFLSQPLFASFRHTFYNFFNQVESLTKIQAPALQEIVFSCFYTHHRLLGLLVFNSVQLQFTTLAWARSATINVKVCFLKQSLSMLNSDKAPHPTALFGLIKEPRSNMNMLKSNWILIFLTDIRKTADLGYENYDCDVKMVKKWMCVWESTFRF